MWFPLADWEWKYGEFAVVSGCWFVLGSRGTRPGDWFGDFLELWSSFGLTEEDFLWLVPLVVVETELVLEAAEVVLLEESDLESALASDLASSLGVFGLDLEPLADPFEGECFALFLDFITSVFKEIGLGRPCSFRNRPQALHSTWPVSSRLHSGVVDVLQFLHIGVVILVFEVVEPLEEVKEVVLALGSDDAGWFCTVATGSASDIGSDVLLTASYNISRNIIWAAGLYRM